MDLNQQIILMKENGLNLQHAPVEMKDDKSIVLFAVKQNGLALEYVSERLSNDLEVVTAALIQNKHAFIHVGLYIKYSIKHTLILLEHKLDIIEYIPNTVKTHMQFLTNAVALFGLDILDQLQTTDETRKKLHTYVTELLLNSKYVHLAAATLGI
jgi:hypothetical protein